MEKKAGEPDGREAKDQSNNAQESWPFLLHREARRWDDNNGSPRSDDEHRERPAYGANLASLRNEKELNGKRENKHVSKSGDTQCSEPESVTLEKSWTSFWGRLSKEESHLTNDEKRESVDPTDTEKLIHLE